MGEGTAPKSPLVIEVDRENPNKDIDRLDIQIPILTPRVYREYKNLSDLDIPHFGNKKFPVISFNDEQQREIFFRDITTEEITHKTILDSNINANYQSVIGYFAQTIKKELHLVGGYDILYGKVKTFIKTQLFDREIDIEDLNILRNLSEIEVTKTIFETFKKKINELTVMDRGEAEIRDYIKISQCRPFVIRDQGFLLPKKSVFNKLIGDSGFELEFASFLENCDDIISYVKNYFAVNFKIDYQNSQGDISNYYPDFIVKRTDKEVYIVETKGLEDVDVKLKIARLDQWCRDIDALQSSVKFDWLFVREDDFKKYKPKNFEDVIKISSKPVEYLQGAWGFDIDSADFVNNIRKSRRIESIMNFFLDTSICVDVLREKSPQKSIELFKRFRSRDKGFVSVISVVELSVGAFLSQKKDAIQKTDDLLTHVTIIDLDQKIAKIGGKIHADLRTLGKEIELNDCLIAATALSLNINQIVTRNQDHFNRIHGFSAITPEDLFVIIE